MAKKDRLKNKPLLNLNPHWVEFTGQKGVLRVLKPGEVLARARGLIFSCPRCCKSKETAHFCIFLFKHPDTPDEVKPLGRFLPSMKEDDRGIPQLESFHRLSLWSDSNPTTVPLHPDGIGCGWEGWVKDGIVYWPTRLRDRLLRH